MPRPLTISSALLPFVLHGLAREVDRGLGLVLRAELEPAGLLLEVGRAMGADGAAAVVRVVAWSLGGLVAWVVLSAWRARQEGTSLLLALPPEVSTFAPLYLRPALSLVALVSVALESSFPYAFTLPVALTQDLGVAQDVAALAVLLALRMPPIRFPAPSSSAVLLVAFLASALLTPEWARQWDGHPGNEPKYLRMAVALGHDLTLDAEGVSAAMEELPVTPLGEALVSSGGALARESWRMAVAVVRGDAGRDAIRATRITRQTLRGKEGGVYYVLAPGPSFVLAPAFRVDRALNRARGTSGRVVVAVLAWNALAALLILAVFLLVRDATGRPGLAATLAFGFGLLPPFLFYFFQFYPEMTGALVLAVAFRALALRPEQLERHPWLLGALFATLPWLHQKFLPVWLVLVATALLVVWKRSQGGPGSGWRRWLAAFLIPQALSLYLTALYNFAITGSVRPDALFLAWGPGGVTTARVGQGLLGILLDARYGILPYVPILILAAAGLALGGARRFAVVLPAALVYYLTVASADNWAGAVCNLGRYFMPVAPLAIALVALALARASERRGVLALALILTGWSVLFALALWRDPIAANDSALLLAKSTWADGNQYIPNLFLRRWADGAPGLWLRIAAWVGAIGLAAAWWRRAVAAPEGELSEAPRRHAAGASPSTTLFGTVAVLLALALVLEQWPASRSSPSFSRALAVGPDVLFFATGDARVRPDELIIGPGRASLLVRAPHTVTSLPVTVGGQGVLRAEGVRPIVLRSTGGRVDLPLSPYHVVKGRGGRRVEFSRTAVAVDGQAVMRPTVPDAAPSRSEE